jgi:hypothetical protein
MSGSIEIVSLKCPLMLSLKFSIIVELFHELFHHRCNNTKSGHQSKGCRMKSYVKFRMNPYTEQYTLVYGRWTFERLNTFTLDIWATTLVDIWATQFQLSTLPIPPQSGCTRLLNQPSNGGSSVSGGWSSSFVCPPVKKYKLFYFRYYKENSIAQTRKPFQIISNVWIHVTSDDQVRHW